MCTKMTSCPITSITQEAQHSGLGINVNRGCDAPGKRTNHKRIRIKLHNKFYIK